MARKTSPADTHPTRIQIIVIVDDDGDDAATGSTQWSRTSREITQNILCFIVASQRSKMRQVSKLQSNRVEPTKFRPKFQPFLFHRPRDRRTVMSVHNDVQL